MNTSKIFSNAVAVCDERKLLGNEQLTRLMSASYDDAVKMLKDYGYADTEESADLDAFFYSQTLDLVEYIKEYCPNKYLLDILLNRYLYVNAKAVYKSQFTARQAEGYGFFPLNVEELKEVLAIKDAYEKMDALGVNDARRIDIILTQCMYDNNLHCATKSHDRTLKRYVVSEIDIKNILTCLRAKRLGKDFEYTSEMIIRGGKLKEDTLRQVFEQGVKGLEDTEYEGLFFDDAVQTETDGEEYLLSVALCKRMDFDSVSPFFGYCLKKMMEHRTVKMILTCIKNGVPQEISKRLRCYYD